MKEPLAGGFGRRCARLSTWFGLGVLALVTSCASRGKPEAKTNASAAAAQRVSFSAGRAYVYVLELDSEVEYAQGASLSLRLRSAIELQRLPDAAPGVALLDLTLPHAHFEQAAGGAPEFSELTRELAQGAVLELERGTVKSLRSEAPLSSFAVNILRSVASAFELPEPTDAAAKTWKADTEDAAGHSTTELTALGAGKYSKRKLAYVESVVAGPREVNLELRLVPKVVASNGILEVQGGTLGTSSYDEQLETELGPGATARAHNRLSLRLESTRAAAPRERAGTKSLDVAAPRVASIDRALLDEAKIGKLTFDSALAELTASAQDEKPLLVTDSARKGSTGQENAEREQRLAEHNRVFSAMTAILRTQLQTVQRATSLIRAGSPAAKVLVDALAAANMDSSNAALVSLVKDTRLSVGLRAGVAHDLSRVETPTSETLRALMELVDAPDYGLVALYGLGTQARHLRDAGQAQLAEQAGKLLTERLSRVHDDEARIHCLRAIANSGLASALPAVRPLLSTRSEVVRSAAIEALRLMDAPEVDGLIAARLSLEPSAFVRRAVLNAAKARKPGSELKAAVLAAADHERDDHGRYAAIALLSRWLPQDASLRPALVHIADSDSVPALRDAARAAL